MASVPIDDTDLDFVFGDPPRRLDAITVLSRIARSLLAIAAVTALILAGVAIHRLNGVVVELGHVSHGAAAQSAHTRAKQEATEPAATCFREAMKAGLPVTVNFANAVEKSLPKTPPAQRPEAELFVRLTRHVEAPLSEYVKLTEKRYAGVVCPDKLHPPRSMHVSPRAK